MYIPDRRQTATLMVAFLVLVSAGAIGAFGAAPTVDTETTETSQDTDLTDKSTQQYNDTTTSNFSWYADSNSTKLEILQNGYTLANFTPDEYYHNSTSGNSYFNVSLADDGSDYTGLVADAGENVTLTFRITNNTSSSNAATTNVTVYFNNNQSEAFTRVEDADSESNETGFVSSLMNGFGLFSSGDDPGAAKATKSVGVNASATDTVTVHVDDSDLQDALTETASAASGKSPSPLGTVKVAGKRVPIFAESQDTPNWINDSETYATVASDGTSVTIHNTDATADSDSIDVKIVGNEAAGYWAQKSMLTEYGVSMTQALQLAWAAQDWNRNPEYSDS